MLIYIKLYLVFANIGILSFGGGYATLPLIQKYIVEKHQWIDLKTMLDLISISQMTPGPIAINSASFVGNKVGGLLGSIVATLGVITPQIIILSVFLYIAYTRFTKYLKGMNSAIVALIFIATIKLINVSLLEKANNIYYLLFALIFILYYKNFNMIKLIIVGAAVGFLNYLRF